MMINGFLDRITRVDSPKITSECKSRDFENVLSSSPRLARTSSSHRRVPSVHEDTPSAFLERYTIEDESFAKGAYGKVSLAVDRVTNERVVIKSIPKSTPIRMIQNEIRIGQSLEKHSNIATFHKYQDMGDSHAMVFQFINGCDLFTYLEDCHFTPQTEANTRIVFSQIAAAIQYCHSKGVAHRDIKLENILINQAGTPFLIDFGLGTIIEDSKKCRDWLGSDNYLAPEIVRRTAYCSFQADIWSLGVTLFALLFGVFPFEDMRVNSRYSNNPRNPLPKLRVRFPTDVMVSSEARELLYGMMEDDPESRMTINDVMSHPWITGRVNCPMEI